jgi:hypothetical protein
VQPPDVGDRMLSAMVTADAEIRRGGFSALFDAFDDRLDLAAEAYRYYGLGDIADALTVMASGRRRHGAFPDRIDVVGAGTLVARAFRRLGVPGAGGLDVAEMLEMATAAYLDRTSPRLSEVFTEHFARDRDQYAPPGHPSTWS